MHISNPELSRSATYRAFQHRLQNLAKQVDQPTHGFFGPESMSWKLFSQPGLAIGGQRALLLQIAHPAVAAGVDRYSNFRKDTFGRAKRTYEAMMQLVFGDIQTATRMAQLLFKIHFQIRGEIYETRHYATKVRTFRASDPDLLLWVLATIVHTSLLAYELVYPPLTSIQKQQFYDESKILAILMGIPVDRYPADLEQFNIYFSKMTEEDYLKVGPTAQAITNALLSSMLLLRPLSVLLATQLLPPRLKTAFGFRTSRTQEHIFMLLLTTTRWLFPKLPRLFWAPPFHQARYRIARSKGARPRLIERCYHWLGRLLRFPATAKVS